MLKELLSHDQLLTELKSLRSAYILIYKQTSEISDCSYKNVEEASSENTVFTVDVNIIRDIHSNYDITSAPSLLYFENGELKNVIKGCMSIDYYKSLFGNALFSNKGNTTTKQKRVTIYTTPTCSWCTTTKNYLKNNNIFFREIDISKNQKAAEDLVKRSGKQGVPQTDINGQIIVGFDQSKFDRLLGI